MKKLLDLAMDFQSISGKVKVTEPDWVKVIRKNSFEQYSKLPDEVSPLYSKYTNANRLNYDEIFFESDYLENESSHEFDERIKELESETGVFTIGNTIKRIFISDDLKKQGVVISSLSDAFLSHGDLIKKNWTKNKINLQEDKYLALENAYFQSGIFVYIPKNVVISEPIRLISSLSKSGSSLISRNIIIADTNSKATIVQELYSSLTNQDHKKDEITTDIEGLATKDLHKQQQSLFELVECHVNAEAALEMVTLQAFSENGVHFSNKKGFIEKDGKMSWYAGLFGGKLTRYKVDNIMNGSGAYGEDVEIVLGMDTQSFDITSNLHHEGPHSKGRVQVKSVMKDTSQSLFKGMIKIGHDAKASESFLAGHAILLDKGAKSDAIPGLEILTNEVKATHSASVAQIDESQIFYLMCRGLSREEAKREIVNGFLEPLSRRMGPTLRAWVNYLIENKWAGKSLRIKTDDVMERILEVEKSRYRETQDLFEKHYKYR